MANGYCFDCEYSISLGKEPYIGQKVTCQRCGAFLEVVELSPIEFEWAYYDDEDIEEVENEYWEEPEY